MLAEFEIVPLGTGQTSISPLLVRVVELIEGSGLNYQLGPMGTTVEGEWDDVMRLVKMCHEAMLLSAGRVITSIRIDDRRDASSRGRITQKVRSLKKKIGRPLKG